MPNQTSGLPKHLFTPTGELDLNKVLLCIKKDPNETGKQNKDECHEKKGGRKRLRRSKSFELRGGVLQLGCDCEKRNGLQDECSRSECHGSPECLTVPPSCGPSEFAGAKHRQKQFEQLMRIKKEINEKRIKLAKEKAYTSKEQKAKNSESTKSEFECYSMCELLKDVNHCPVCTNPIPHPKPVPKTSSECPCCPTSCVQHL